MKEIKTGSWASVEGDHNFLKLSLEYEWQKRLRAHLHRVIIYLDEIEGAVGPVKVTGESIEEETGIHIGQVFH